MTCAALTATTCLVSSEVLSSKAGSSCLLGAAELSSHKQQDTCLNIDFAHDTICALGTRLVYKDTVPLVFLPSTMTFLLYRSIVTCTWSHWCRQSHCQLGFLINIPAVCKQATHSFICPTKFIYCSVPQCHMALYWSICFKLFTPPMDICYSQCSTFSLLSPSHLI